jgi:hypothetical protein
MIIAHAGQCGHVAEYQFATEDVYDPEVWAEKMEDLRVCLKRINDGYVSRNPGSGIFDDKRCKGGD